MKEVLILSSYEDTRLTANEQRIYRLIRNNPYISQQELAEAIGLSRPSVANIISGLIRQNIIRGKAYILNETAPLVCIGGANVDRKLTAKEPLQSGTSNPATSVQTAGGVARNVAENLGRLENDTALITAAGDDADWQLINQATASAANLERIALIPGATTGSYTAVLGPDGEMALALADMDVFDEALTAEFLRQHEAYLATAKLLVADLNLPGETVAELIHIARRRDIPLAILAVSVPKMDRLPADLTGVTWLMTNRQESETALSTTIDSGEAAKQAVRRWQDKGAANVIITDGANGAYHAGHGRTEPAHTPAAAAKSVVDVTGAGDAFAAAVLHTWLHGATHDEAIAAGMTNANATLAVPHTVRRDLNAETFSRNTIPKTETEA